MSTRVFYRKKLSAITKHVLAALWCGGPIRGDAHIRELNRLIKNEYATRKLKITAKGKQAYRNAFPDDYWEA